jgi:hypothetical protein
LSSPQPNSFWNETGFPTDRPVSFRFPVTWEFVARRVQPIRRKNETALAAPKVREITQTLSSVEAGPQWEMVVPKMARPATPKALPEVAPAASNRKESTQPVEKETTPPEFNFVRDPLWVRAWSRLSVVARVTLAGSVLVVGAGAWMWWSRQEAAATSSVSPPAILGGGWTRQRVYYGAGSNEIRRLVLYREAQNEADYRLQFKWSADAKGIAWVFRVRDTGNYYAARLTLYRDDRLPTLKAEHFAVVAGIEREKRYKLTTLSESQARVTVLMEASGPAFTLSVDGHPVDYWTDARFASGGVGFMEARNEQLNIDSVRITFPNPSTGFKSAAEGLRKSP